MKQSPTRRDTLKLLGSTGALLAVGAGTTAAEGKRTGASGDTTIVDIAVESDDFNVLVAAVAEAGLVDALSGDDQLTVFAPTDAAFEAIGITADNVGDVDDDLLQNVLLYHVTEGRRYANSVVNAPRIGMLNGEDVAVDGTVLNDGDANIVATDIEASNGVIHVIDGVLEP